MENTIISERLVIHKDNPHLEASPDGYVKFMCCGCGEIEVKCPFVLKNESFFQAMGETTFCLENSSGSVSLKAQCHYIVLSVTKNSKSAILRAPQNGGKSLTSAHELVYAIAYSLVGISVIVNKEWTKTKRLFDGGEEAV